MLTLFALVVIVFTKRQWLRAIAWGVWSLGLLYSFGKGTFFLYIPATAMILGILYLIRWIIRKVGA